MITPNGGLNGSYSDPRGQWRYMWDVGMLGNTAIGRRVTTYGGVMLY